MKEPCETNNGHLPKDWEEVSIDDITTIVYRYPTYYGITYVDEGVPEVRGELLLDNGEIESDRSKFRFVTEDTANKFPKVRLELGDIVMSVRGTMGKIGIVREPLKGGVITANLIRLSSKQAVILPDFFRLALLTPEFIHALNSASPQTTIKTITAPALKDLTLAVPHSIGEQRKIAAVLGLVQRAIEQQERLIALTTELKKALLHKLFTEGLRGETQKQTEIGPVPESWEVVRLGDAFDTQLGKMLSQKAHVGNDPKPYLRNKNVQWGRIDLSDMLQMDFSEREKEKFLLVRGDLLVCEGGEPGRAAIWNGDMRECYYQKALHRLRPKDERITNEFLAYWLLFSLGLQNLYGVAGASSTIAHLPEVQLKALAIPCPERWEQDESCAILGHVDAQIAVLDKKRATLADLFRSLLHQLMTAEIRVHELDLPELEQNDTAVTPCGSN